MKDRAAPLAVKKSHKDGTIGVTVRLRASGWSSDNVRLEGSTTLMVEQARAFAAALTDAADQEDAKAQAKQAADQRRQKWRDREVAAGRMIVIGPRA